VWSCTGAGRSPTAGMMSDVSAWLYPPAQASEHVARRQQRFNASAWNDLHYRAHLLVVDVEPTPDGLSGLEEPLL
jgi:hypothetical protein